MKPKNVNRIAIVEEESTESPICFGNYQENDAECRKCVFWNSCNVCSDNTDRKIDSVGRSVPFHEVENVVSDNTHNTHAHVNVSCEAIGNSELRDVLSFLMDMDNYTAELLSEVMYGECTSSADLGRKIGVSRQAVHRKLIDCCTQYPELRNLFRIRLNRCKRIQHDSNRKNLVLHARKKMEFIQGELF